MPRISNVPARLDRRRATLSGPAQQVIRICQHHDGRFPPMAISILVAIAIRICRGQRHVTKGEISADCRIAPKNIGRWMDRLVEGGYLEREFQAGPTPARYALRVPSEAQMAWRWPDGRKETAVAEPTCQLAGASLIDAERHRALSRKFGFSDATDQLLRLRENLRRPSRLAGLGIGAADKESGE